MDCKSIFFCSKLVQFHGYDTYRWKKRLPSPLTSFTGRRSPTGARNRVCEMLGEAPGPHRRGAGSSSERLCGTFQRHRGMYKGSHRGTAMCRARGRGAGTYQVVPVRFRRRPWDGLRLRIQGKWLRFCIHLCQQEVIDATQIFLQFLFSLSLFYILADFPRLKEARCLISKKRMIECSRKVGSGNVGWQVYNRVGWKCKYVRTAEKRWFLLCAKCLRWQRWPVECVSSGRKREKLHASNKKI